MRYINSLFTITFICFGLLPLLPIKLKGTPVILLLVATLFVVLKTKKIFFSKRVFFFLSSLFFVNIFSLFINLNFPIKQIETILSLLVVPLAFAFWPAYESKRFIPVFIITFTLSCFLLSVVHFYYYFTSGILMSTELKVNSFRKIVTELPIIGEHPIYLSIYFSLSILFAFFYFPKVGKWSRFFLIITSLFLFINLILLSSKGVLVSLFVTFLIVSFLLIRSFKTKLVVFITLLFIMFSLVRFFPTLERRFRELTIQTTYTKIMPTNSTSVRVGIYKCVLKTIIKKPLFGYGFGTLPQTGCYKNTSKHLYDFKYNSHNQYLGFLLNFGVIGLLTIVLFLVKLIILSYKKKNYLFLSIIILFASVMLTENILERQSAIILFIFLISLYYTIYVNNNKKSINNATPK